MAKSLSLQLIYEQCQKSGGTLSEWWWCLDDSIRILQEKLDNDNYIVVDNFLSPLDAELLKEQILCAHKYGLLSEQGVIAGGRRGHDESFRDSLIRGDMIGYFDGDESNWNGPTFRSLLDKMNTLVCEMKAPKSSSLEASRIASELRNISTRSRAMVTCYPGSGAHYSRHCDNAIGNGRKLTSIYYTNSNWEMDHGGCLRLYKTKYEQSLISGQITPKSSSPSPSVVETVAAAEFNACSKDFVDIPPLFNRLVLFWSDKRCPHEVLPCHRHRFAVTVWFIDKIERQRAEAETLELERIRLQEGELERMRLQEGELERQMGPHQQKERREHDPHESSHTISAPTIQTGRIQGGSGPLDLGRPSDTIKTSFSAPSRAPVADLPLSTSESHQAKTTESTSASTSESHQAITSDSTTCDSAFTVSFRFPATMTVALACLALDVAVDEVRLSVAGHFLIASCPFADLDASSAVASFQRKLNKLVVTVSRTKGFNCIEAVP